jgi:hypothetical protein
MNEEIFLLKSQAEHYRSLYQMNKCTREEAKENIMPYINLINNKSKEIAKKYNQKPKIVNFASYIR